MFENINIEQVKQIAILLGFMAVSYAVFYAYQKYLFVKKSVGWNFIESLAKVKIGAGGNDLVLEIVSQSGRKTYEPVKQTPIINYNIKNKGKDVKKGVIYDERAVEFLNGIPVLKCTPNDIRPIDRDTGLLVNVPPEIIEKLSVDASKSAEGEMKRDKLQKMLTYGLIGVCILFIIGLAYVNQTNSEVQAELLRCTLELGRSATVIGE